jgi:hypothetical protein
MAARPVQLLLPRHGEIQRSGRALPAGREFFDISAARPPGAGVCALAGNAATAGPGYPYRHAGSLFDISSGHHDWFNGAGGARYGNDGRCVARPGSDAPAGLGTPASAGAF